MPLAANLYYFEHRGNDTYKPPIVLIHGAGGSHLHWPAPIRRLSEYFVYAVDLPGHGKSEGRGQQAIEAYAESIIEWMHAIKLRQAIFIGHSMGGAIALSLGLQYPDLVIGLGLVGSGARLKITPALLDISGREESFSSTVETIIEWAFDPHADPGLVELATKRMAEIRPSVLHSDFVACNTFNVLNEIKQLGIPTFMLCGENDRLTPPRYSQYLADNIPNSEIVIIPEAGHMVQLEKPDQVANAIADFVSKVPYQPGAAGK